MMQRSTRVETAGIKCTLIHMRINVRSKVGVVKINFFSLDVIVSARSRTSMLAL